MKKLTNKKQLFIILTVVIALLAISSNVLAAVPISITPPDSTSTTGTTTGTTSYIVTFNTNGGNSVQSQTVTSGSTATRPATNPTKEGYTFDDWYADASFTTKFNFTEAITSNVTVYAKWNTSSTVTPTSTVTPVATNTTSGDESLPQTGDAEDYAIFALIGVSAIVATVAFVKAKKYNLK